ncbi:MAG: glycosyltransferase, partial [Polyangiaceae bacterium]|nr:glycosyltransferase [Polyangiaceae bacterium]
VRELAERVDVFVAPARCLGERHGRELRLPADKLVFLDYGFDLERLRGRRRVPGEPFTFGYIGTHLPAKGIHDLLRAFGAVRGGPRLRIWGRPRGQDSEALHAIARSLPAGCAERVEWLPEYRNQDLVRDVFDRVDAIVVPSIWTENSPLVIHEAQGARVPVVTADVGGMAELVRHEVNGLSFRHRSPEALAEQLQRCVDDPALARRLGERGYLRGPSGEVPAIEEHALEIERLYERVVRRRDSARVEAGAGPWRITFDTNPDTCNRRCVMCEQHSPHGAARAARTAQATPPRVMPIELVRRVVASAAAHGLREIIPSTMGEPLLYEHFEELLALCSEHGVRLNLTTNGSFPRLGARAWAERIVPVASDVKLSWNGATKATQERIMLGSVWERSLANVETFVAVRDDHAARGGTRCRVTFQLTFMEDNVAELAGVVRLARRLGVDRVKGHHLWAHFDPIRDQSMRRDPAAIARWNRAVLEAREAAAEGTLPNGRPVLLENLHLLDDGATRDLAPGGPCPFLGQEAWVSAEGRFDPCCAPDASRRTLGDLGSLHGQDLAELWRAAPYRHLLATYRNRALCLGCNLRRPATVAP